MKAFKVVLKVVLGVAFWGYIFALLFIEGTYHPFMKKDADTAAKTVVEKTEPARTQTRIQTYAAPTGISVYTSTDSVELSSQQLYFSGVATKAEATKSVAAKCRRRIEGYEDQLKCKEVTFFTQGCYARYRIGNGHASSFGPTEEEAQAKAKQKCDVMAEKFPYSCILDTNKCVSGGGNNQGSRSWDYRAIAITEKFVAEDGKRSLAILDKDGISQEEAKNKVAKQCLSVTGKPCKNITTIDGYICLAAAIHYQWGFSVKLGDKKDEGKLRAEVTQMCTRNGATNCTVRFFCPR